MFMSVTFSMLVSSVKKYDHYFLCLYSKHKNQRVSIPLSLVTSYPIITCAHPTPLISHPINYHLLLLLCIHTELPPVLLFVFLSSYHSQLPSVVIFFFYFFFCITHIASAFTSSFRFPSSILPDHIHRKLPRTLFSLPISSVCCITKAKVTCKSNNKKNFKCVKQKTLKYKMKRYIQ